MVCLFRSPVNVQPPLPPRQSVGKQDKQAKKKGAKNNEGDNFDEEPLFPKYENIFHFVPKEKKTSPASDSSAPEGKPFQSSVLVISSKPQAELNTTIPENQDNRLR